MASQNVSATFRVGEFTKKLQQCTRDVDQAVYGLANEINPSSSSSSSQTSADVDTILDLSDIQFLSTTSRLRREINDLVSSIDPAKLDATASKFQSNTVLTAKRIEAVLQLAKPLIVKIRPGSGPAASTDRRPQRQSRLKAAIQKRSQPSHKRQINYHVSQREKTRWISTSHSKSDNRPSERPPMGDCVLRIVLYRRSRHRSVAKQVEILGSQTLTHLVDFPEWSCAVDLHVPHSRPNIPQSFFLIGNDLFYDDRVEDGTPGQTTAGAMAHMLHQKRFGTQTGDADINARFNLRKMSETTFSSLSIQLGAFYVYFHQGNCEHTFAILDVKQVTVAQGAVEGYPRLPFKSRGRPRLCSVCSTARKKKEEQRLRDATVVTFDDRLAGTDLLLLSVILSCDHGPVN